jgi:hypothetical protein
MHRKDVPVPHSAIPKVNARTHARTHARSRAHKHMHAVARRQMRMCKLASTNMPTATNTRTAYTHYIRKRSHARWRSVAHRCTRMHAPRRVREGTRLSRARWRTNTHGSAQAEPEQLKCEAEEQHSLGPMLLHWQRLRRTQRRRRGWCVQARACGWTIGRASDCRAQAGRGGRRMKLHRAGAAAGRFAATCHAPRLRAQEGARMAAQVARALVHLEAHTILHRDIQPANVLLDECGRPRCHAKRPIFA